MYLYLKEVCLQFNQYTKPILHLLTDWFARKNSRRHLYLQCLLLLTRFRFVQLLMRKIPSNLEVYFHSAPSWPGAQYKHRVLFTENDNHWDIFTKDDHLTHYFRCALWIWNLNVSRFWDVKKGRSANGMDLEMDLKSGSPTIWNLYKWLPFCQNWLKTGQKVW